MEEVNLERFLDWAAKLGITDSPVEIQSESCSCLGQSLSVSDFPDAGGRGIGAVRDLRKGELILRVPKSALMTSESLMKDHTLSVAVRNHSSLSPIQILIVALLNEVCKGKSSWWYPYLVQLPRSYDTLASFGLFEIQALQVDDAIWAAEKAVSKAELEWKNAIALMEELRLKPQLVTFRAWLWASATISSRTLHVPWDDAGCLCPVGDFFNYAAPEESDVEQFESNSLRLTDGGYNEDISAYCFYAKTNYARGDQVLLSYGTYTNLELLEHYGFLLTENPNDKAFIPLLPKMISLRSWPNDSLYIHQNGKPSFALLSTVRLWATPPNQRRSIGYLAYSGSQVSTTNEIIVMEWMLNNCQVILKNFVTSVEEDELLLKTIDKMCDLNELIEIEKVVSGFKAEICAFLEINGAGEKLNLCGKTRRVIDRWKLAVEWRLRYKKILVDCISYCSERLDWFSSQDDSKRTDR
ncbi:hypothetical protein LguiA_013809 [Lonicera macranthoides]